MGRGLCQGWNQACQQGDRDGIGMAPAPRRKPDLPAAAFQEVFRNELVNHVNECRVQGGSRIGY